MVSCHDRRAADDGQQTKDILVVDHSKMRLGKRPRRHDVRTLKLARYLTPSLPSAPARVDYSCGITDFGVMLNDQLGCCTIAAVAHAVQVWTANSGIEVSFPDSVILDYYKTWDGYDPANPATDQGGVELDVLNDWRQQGFAGQTLDAYAAIELGARDSRFGIRDTGHGTARQKLDVENPGSGVSGSGIRESLTPNPPSLIETAIWLFGGAYIGLELPLTAQTQEVWDLSADSSDSADSQPGSWGGHAVYLVAYDATNSQTQIANSGAVTTPPLSAPACLDPVTTLALGAPARVNAVTTPALSPPARLDPVTTPAPSAPPLLNQEGSFVALNPSTVYRMPSTGFLTCITWGQLKKMTWRWFAKYCSEAYGLVSKDWLKACGISPSGFDLGTLEADLKAVSGP
jgi:hypothetical protein